MDKNEIILANERKLQQFNKLDRNQVDELLADDFVEFGSSGQIYDKALILKHINQLQPPRVKTTEFKTQEIAPNTVLATYRADKLDGNNNVQEASRRSSIWQEQDGKWRLVFHQGTLLPN